MIARIFLGLLLCSFVGCATFTLASDDERESEFSTDGQTQFPAENDPKESPATDSPATEPAPRGEVVVLVHGMIRSPLSMKPLADHLESQGYDVFNWGYSSTCCGIAELGERLQDDLAEYRKEHSGPVHFVGHSLGNIIIRWTLTKGTPPEDVGRVVMLAPPNQGSSKADLFAPLLGNIIKPISELQTDAESTARKLPEIEHAKVGVIAGKYDDKVSVDESHLAEETDHIVVPAFHSFLMFREDVKHQILTFLETGEFEHRVESSDGNDQNR
ncbi:MAG: esterase/lipase family protein [Planctomycetaceae bacterium]